MRSRKLLATAAVATLLATQTAAATFDFSFFGGDFAPDGAGGGTFSREGVSGTVSASADFGNSRVVQLFTGLGIRTGFGGGGFLDDPTIDGDLFNSETLTFTFDAPVRLFEVVFGGVGADTDWDVFVNGSLVAGDSTTNPFLFTGPVTANSFAVRADELPDSFALAGLTAVIPLPASLPLLATAVAGFAGWAARRRKA